MYLRLFYRLGLAFALLHSASCVLLAQTSSQPNAGPHSLTAAPKTAMGTINGSPIYPSEMTLEVQNRIRSVENELAQRRMHLMWVGMEELIDKKLVQEAATKEGVSPTEILKKNTATLLREPSENEIRIIFDLNREALGVSYEIAKPFLKERLIQQEREELESTFLGSLRKNATIDYQIQVPNLPRIRMDSSNAPTSGPADAKVTLVEFSDFQCPYCARAKDLIKQLQELYPKNLKIVFRDFPLDQHPRATAAAVAAQCANQQGKFWEFHDLLFANSTALEDDDFDKYAQQVGLKSASFKDCRSSPQVFAIIKENKSLGVKYGVEGTPAIYINGIKLVGLLPLPLIRAIIDKEIGD